MFLSGFKISLVMHEAELGGATELLLLMKVIVTIFIIITIEELLLGFLAEKLRVTSKASHGSGGR